MPELPEVEVVRRGLEGHVVGRQIAEVELRGSRVARRYAAGPAELAARLRGAHVREAARRGKYLWLVLDGPAASGAGLVVHLGMSGQLLVEDPSAPDEKHLHARFRFADDGPELRFVDQRTFGGLALADLDGDGIPEPVAHIARDLLDPALDRDAVVQRIKGKDSAVKRVLLDQTVVSGVGNIYADEALWRAQVHGERWASSLTKPAIGRLLDHARDVMAAALDEGGTSFDALYVNVNGASGYFDRSLNAYGQEGRPCARCGTPIRRESFMNRSSASCPRCQPRLWESGGMTEVRVTVFVSGHVQGVGFRWWTRARALELGLVGHARNTDDGRVEVVAQGPEPAAYALLNLLRELPSTRRRPGRVTAVSAPLVSAPRDGVTGFVER